MTQDRYPFAYFEDKVVRIEDARISVMTNALHYGTGVFGGIRGYWNSDRQTIYLFRPLDHLRRFFGSLKILNVSIKYSEEEILKLLVDLTQKNRPTENVYFRPLAYAGSLNLAPNLARDRDFSFTLYLIPLNEYLPTDKGLRVKISSWRRISDNAIPARGKFTGAYINSALARREATDNGYDEAIVLSENGHVAEGSAENLFIVRRGVLITPSVENDILEGITRSTIITLAREMKIPVSERPVDRSELYLSEEAFFSGTGVQIAWISSVDQVTVGNGKLGPVTEKLRDRYMEIALGRKIHPDIPTLPVKIG